ncbi:MAG: FtsX-like permease family protein, partial [Bacteroides sp.]|nr:FtsX-like permease family protein [Bacteroides sp.]
RPITQEESASAMSVAVLSASLAQKLFATTEATGKHFLLDGKDFQVCGVVSDVSNATPQTAADLWIPIYHHQMVQRTNEEGMGLLGTATAYLLVDNAANKKMVKQEVRELVRQYSLQEKEFEYNLKGQPDDYWESTFRTFTKVPNREEIIKSLLYILLALLFIPALNLSGMISSRMGKRLCELGIRKAYGATNGRLLNQVLCENLLLTATGGLLGLLFSYLIVLTSSDWVLALFDATYSGASIALTSRMLLNPAVFGAAFGLCVLLNVVSALIPAISALRHPIIYSLNTNR